MVGAAYSNILRGHEHERRGLRETEVQRFLRLLERLVELLERDTEHEIERARLKGLIARFADEMEALDFGPALRK